MKNLLLLLMLFLQKLSFSQDPCLPSYTLPVKRIEVSKGLNIGYVEGGKGSTVLLLHGLGGNISHWEPAIKVLSQKHQVYAIDFPGYGTSNKTAQDTSADILNFYADVVEKFIKEKKLGRVTLVGHSMGGQVAIITALKYPARIKKLVLVAPAGLETFTQQEGAALIAATQPHQFESQDEPAIRASYKNNFYENPSKAEDLVQDRLRLKNCPDYKNYTMVVSAGVKGMLNQPVRSLLKKIKQPVLIIFGDSDALIPNPFLHPSLTREKMIGEAIDDMFRSKFIMIPQAGHLVQYEKPEAVSKAIHQFIK